jgi:hypothetical protein
MFGLFRWVRRGIWLGLGAGALGAAGWAWWRWRHRPALPALPGPVADPYGPQRSPEAARIVAAYPAAAPIVDRLITLAGYLGAQPAWIANVIQFESQWNPAAKNPNGSATGLIQFVEDTARKLGTTTASLRTLSVLDQWPYVEAYFSPYKGRLTSQSAVFMAVFYPSAIGKGDAFAFPASVTRVNPGIYTAGDYTRMALRVARLPA